LKAVEADIASPEQDVDLIHMHEALNTLAELDERKSRTVELRYFAGLSVEETAEVMGGLGHHRQTGVAQSQGLALSNAAREMKPHSPITLLETH